MTALFLLVLVSELFTRKVLNRHAVGSVPFLIPFHVGDKTQLGKHRKLGTDEELILNPVLLLL